MKINNKLKWTKSARTKSATDGTGAMKQSKI